MMIFIFHHLENPAKTLAVSPIPLNTDDTSLGPPLMIPLRSRISLKRLSRNSQLSLKSGEVSESMANSVLFKTPKSKRRLL